MCSWRLAWRPARRAGGYVCNHLFYTARHVIDGFHLPTQCGFVHVPLCTEQVETDTQAIGTLPRAKLVEAIECCIRVVRDDTLSRRV